MRQKLTLLVGLNVISSSLPAQAPRPERIPAFVSLGATERLVCSESRDSASAIIREYRQPSVLEGGREFSVTYLGGGEVLITELEVSVERLLSAVAVRQRDGTWAGIRINFSHFSQNGSRMVKRLLIPYELDQAKALITALEARPCRSP